MHLQGKISSEFLMLILHDKTFEIKASVQVAPKGAQWIVTVAGCREAVGG
jgi:hypothetical protein